MIEGNFFFLHILLSALIYSYNIHLKRNNYNRRLNLNIEPASENSSKYFSIYEL